MGKLFYSCSRFPECRFASWNRLLALTCPECGYTAMAEKVRKGGKSEIVCARKGCKGKMPGDALNAAG